MTRLLLSNKWHVYYHLNPLQLHSYPCFRLTAVGVVLIMCVLYNVLEPDLVELYFEPFVYSEHSRAFSSTKLWLCA